MNLVAVWLFVITELLAFGILNILISKPVLFKIEGFLKLLPVWIEELKKFPVVFPVWFKSIKLKSLCFWIWKKSPGIPLSPSPAINPNFMPTGPAWTVLKPETGSSKLAFPATTKACPSKIVTSRYFILEFS